MTGRITSDFYVYAHAVDGEVAYIGKGRGTRAQTFIARSKAWKDRFGERKPSVIYLHTGLTDGEAKELERVEIKARSGLVNVAKADLSPDVAVSVSEWFFRLGMTEDMRRAIEDWRVENREPETGKVPSFAEACRALIERGLNNEAN